MGNTVTQERTRELILQLKEVKTARSLSCQDILDLILEAGGYTSLSTVKRVFAEGSENQSFRFKETLQPIASVLLGVREETAKDDSTLQYIAQIDALKSIALLKDSMINDLHAEVNLLLDQHKQLRRIIMALCVSSATLILGLIAALVFG